MIPSTTQVLSMRAANDILAQLRCEDDLLVNCLLDRSGTRSRIVVSKLGELVMMFVKSYNAYTARQMAAIDASRGKNIARSNFIQRMIDDASVSAIEQFFAGMVKNNANDPINRMLRIAAIFIGLTITIEFRTEFTPPPVYQSRSFLLEAKDGAGASQTASAAKTAAEKKEQLRRDQQRCDKIDPDALRTFLQLSGSNLMSRFFDGAISLADYARLCGFEYLSYKSPTNEWICRRFREIVEEQQHAARNAPL